MVNFTFFARRLRFNFCYRAMVRCLVSTSRLYTRTRSAA